MLSKGQDNGNLDMMGPLTWESLGFDFCATLARDMTNSRLKLGEASDWSYLVLLKFII